MGIIQKLDEALISKIAAGEVLSRPASALRELIDNALDSRPSCIVARIEAGGIKLVQVEDDGCGIAKDDLPMAVERHATSKIHTFDDLFKLATLGFRGEALASISSVSRMEIVSRIDQADCAYKMFINEACIDRIEPAARTHGTTVSVRDIFHFVPARKEFLKSPITEARHCESVFKSLCLANPSVGFKWIKDGKQQLNFPPQSALDRWKSLVKCPPGKNCLTFSDQAGGYEITGFCLPAPAMGDWCQASFVNGRFIKDRIFSHACKEALRSVFGTGNENSASFCIYLELPADQVDVNVHPEKKEVRFKHPQMVHQLVFAALKKAFEQIAPQSLTSDAAQSPGLGQSAFSCEDESLFASPFCPSNPVPASSEGLPDLRAPDGHRAALQNNVLYALDSAQSFMALAAGNFLDLLDQGPAPEDRLIYPVALPPDLAQSLLRKAKQLNYAGVSIEIAPETGQSQIVALPKAFPNPDAAALIKNLALWSATPSAGSASLASMLSLASPPYLQDSELPRAAFHPSIDLAAFTRKILRLYDDDQT